MIKKVEKWLENNKILKKLLRKKTLKQFIKFGLVGVSNTLLSLMIYYILIYFNVHYIIANLIGFLISVLNSFVLNNKYVFTDKKKESLVKRLIKVYLSYGSTFILGTLLLSLQVEIINISSTIAPIINLFITIPLNFILNKKWAFKS